jgi:hypothetical protein
MDVSDRIGQHILKELVIDFLRRSRIKGQWRCEMRLDLLGSVPPHGALADSF